MSIDLCKNCDDAIDTDYNPEVYREELDFLCICEACWEKYTVEELLELQKGEQS